MEAKGKARVQGRTCSVYNVKICFLKKKKKKEEEGKLQMRIFWVFGFDLGFVLKRQQKYPSETRVGIGPYLTKISHNSLPRKVSSDLSDKVHCPVGSVCVGFFIIYKSDLKWEGSLEAILMVFFFRQMGHSSAFLEQPQNT